MRTFLLSIIIVAAFAGTCFGQDTLPRISVKNISNQIIISWTNNYGAKIANINIQRSSDSIKNFTTIGTVLNPLNKENGYVDGKAPNPNMFYRVFVAFEGGTYIFSRSHRPVIELPKQIDTASVVRQKTEDPITLMDFTAPTATQPTLETPDLSNPGEDLLPPTRKFIKPKPPTGFVPSKFIYANRENNLIVSLPDADKEKFSLYFFDEKDRPVFEIKNIKESYLIVEKVNFLHTGWFYYHLYDDGILLEKYKFYIAKDGWIGPPPPETKRPIMTEPQ